MQIKHLGSGLDDPRLRHGKGLTETTVKPLGQITRKFQVLTLIFPDGDFIGLINQNVSRLQDGIGEQANGGSVSTTTSRLVLELRHATGFTKPRYALHHPGQLGMFWHLALNKQRATLRLEASGQELGR